MIIEVICKESFNMPHFNGIKYFTKGIRYKYATDNLESLCDEQIYHVIDGYLISFETFKSKFLILEDWRDEQLNNLI